MSQNGAAVSPTPASAAYVPEAFGKYYLIDKVAVGGMAEIFKAKTFGEGGFENLFIIKRIVTHMSDNEQFIQMFLDEARITALLQHSNVVRIYDFGKIQSNYFLAMDFVDGKDVKHILRKMYGLGKQLHIQLAVYIAMEAAKGLDYAHKKTNLQGQPLHIVHRDISPSNILVSYNGEVKVADFGIVKSAVVNETTSAGTLKGKFEYMSPEQASGIEVDRRSDIFSLGVVMWEMLTGRRAFKTDSEIKTLERVRSVDLDPPSALNPQVSARLDAIIKQALARDPKDRYQDARELQADLLDFLYPASPDFIQNSLAHFMAALFSEEIAGERSRQEENSRLARALHDSAVQMDLEPEWQETPSGTQATAPVPPPPSNRLPLVAIAAALGLVSVAAIGTAAWVMTRPDPAAAPTALSIKIAQPATEILVDDKLVGTGSTLELKDIEPGTTHTLRVEAEGFQPYTDTFTVAPGETVRLAINLAEEQKKVAEVTPPPPLPPEAKDPREEKKKDERDEKKKDEKPEQKPPEPVVEVKPPEPPPPPKEEKKEVAAAPGKLSVNVKGGWADVWVDGKKVGSTPIFGKELAAGSHKVQAKNDAIGLDQTKSVTIKPGETSTVSFSP